MKFVRSVIFFVASMFFASSGFCETGNELLERLQSPSSSENLRAYSYIHAVLDYEELIKFKEVSEMMWAPEAAKRKKFTMKLICMPDGVTGKQIFDIVKQYLENNPSIRHENALQFVRTPLLEAWPCKGNVEQSPQK